MRLMAERMAILQECELSEAQARVYLALLEFPGTTASNLAKCAQVPRNRLYEVIEDLSAHELVDIVLEEPRRYRARSVDAFLDRCAQELRTKADRLESRKTYLTAAFSPRGNLTADDHDRGRTQVLNGRRSVAHEIERLMGEANRELVLAGSSGGALRLASHLLEVRPNERGVAIEFYAPAATAQSGGWETFTEAGIVPVHWIEADRATLVVIADKEEMLRIHPVPDDERIAVGHDFAMLTDNLAIIHDELLGIRSLAKQSKLQPAKSG